MATQMLAIRHPGLMYSLVLRLEFGALVHRAGALRSSIGLTHGHICITNASDRRAARDDLSRRLPAPHQPQLAARYHRLIVEAGTRHDAGGATSPQL